MFTATITERSSEAVIHLDGELDMATTPHLVGVVHGAMNAGYDLIVLDLVDLRFVDSTGLAGIARLCRRAGELSIKLVLQNPSESTAKVLSITNFDALIDIRKS